MTAIPQEGTSSNRYQILGRLAGGGMADIFLARSSSSDAGVERYVVLKRVLAERSRDPHFATMFLDEARLASQLQHPNIAQVHDIGKLGGSYFYTMEYVHGEDLRHVLMRLFALRRAFPLPLVLHVASGALAGLHHAHTRTTRDGKPLGVVHRDVSPSNVMVSYEGGIKMLDFGVAKATQHSAESRSGTIKGKIAYLSPEQCQGSPIDRRSDIYSLGIVLHEMITGRRLYKRDTDFATMMAIVQEPVAPPSQQRPDVSRELDYLVLTALEKDPNKRFATAADMVEALEALAARERYVMYGTALGKFMRELFGDRPEPWLEIQAREEVTKAITVTGESVAGLDPLAGAMPIAMGVSAGGQVPESLSSGEVMIQQQLDQAPPIGRPADRGSDSIPRATQPSLGSLVPQAYPIQRPDTDADAPTADERAPAPSALAVTTLGLAPAPPMNMAHSSSPPELRAHSSSQPGMPAYPIAPEMRAAHSSSQVGMPAYPSAPPEMRAAHSSSQVGMPAYPSAPPEMMAEYRSQSGAPVLVVPRVRRRSFVIFASALVVILAILGVMLFVKQSDRTQVVAAGSDGSAAAGSDPTGSDTGSGTGSSTDVATGSSTNPEVVPEAVDAAVAVPHAGSDAAPHAGSDAAPHAGSDAAPHAGSDAPSLADLVTAGSFTEAAARCATTPPTNVLDRTRCGIAACSVKQRAAALGYFNATTGAAQLQIERACKDKGLALRPHVITPPLKNPCDDKKFREENPLKCQ